MRLIENQVMFNFKDNSKVYITGDIERILEIAKMLEYSDFSILHEANASGWSNDIDKLERLLKEYS